jgi:hypothetical protein
MRVSSIRAMTCVVALIVIAAGCATQRGADIRVNAAPDANFSGYNTFGFPEQTGTDRGGYSTFVTDYFKAAVRDQMEQRGYRYVDENPDLLINFYANVRERTEVRSRPGPPAYGYYGYRYGLYDAWPRVGLPKTQCVIRTRPSRASSRSCSRDSPGVLGRSKAPGPERLRPSQWTAGTFVSGSGGRI